MTSHESEPTPDQNPLEVPASVESAGEAELASTDRRHAAALIWILTLTAGLAAGFGGWAAVESIYGSYQPSVKSSTSTPNPEEAAVRDMGLRKAMIIEASLAFGTLGAVLGLTFGMAGGLARRSFRGGLAAAAIGMMLGAAGGLAAGRILTPMHYNLSASIDDDLIVALVVQGAICAVVGAMAGAAFSLGLGEDDERFDFRLVAGGLLGALAGLIVYQIAGVVAFPLDDTTLPISNTWGSRYLAKALVAGFAAIGVMLAMSANTRAR